MTPVVTCGAGLDHWRPGTAPRHLDKVWAPRIHARERPCTERDRTSHMSGYWIERLTETQCLRVLNGLACHWRGVSLEHGGDGPGQGSTRCSSATTRYGHGAMALDKWSISFVPFANLHACTHARLTDWIRVQPMDQWIYCHPHEDAHFVLFCRAIAIIFCVSIVAAVLSCGLGNGSIYVGTLITPTSFIEKNDWMPHEGLSSVSWLLIGMREALRGLSHAIMWIGGWVRPLLIVRMLLGCSRCKRDLKSRSLAGCKDVLLLF